MHSLALACQVAESLLEGEFVSGPAGSSTCSDPTSTGCRRSRQRLVCDQSKSNACTGTFTTGEEAGHQGCQLPPPAATVALHTECSSTICAPPAGPGTERRQVCWRSKT